MPYPGQDESDQRRARAWGAQYLAEPVRRIREEGGSIAESMLAQLHADSGMPLESVKLRWRDGIAMGQMLGLYFKQRKLAPSSLRGRTQCGRWARTPESTTQASRIVRRGLEQCRRPPPR